MHTYVCVREKCTQVVYVRACVWARLHVVACITRTYSTTYLCTYVNMYVNTANMIDPIIGRSREKSRNLKIKKLLATESRQNI